MERWNLYTTGDNHRKINACIYLINMRNQHDWLEIYKQHKNLQSDYRLAMHWNIHRSRISKYKSGVLHLELERILTIADTLQIDPMEVIVSIEFSRPKTSLENEVLKRHYFEAMKKTIALRMARVHSGYGFKKR